MHISELFGKQVLDKNVTNAGSAAAADSGGHKEDEG